MAPTTPPSSWLELAAKAGLVVGWLVGVVGGTIAILDRFRQRVTVSSRWMDELTGGPSGLASGSRTTVLVVEVINRRSYDVRITGLEFWRRGSKKRAWFLPGPGASFTYPVEVPAHDSRALTVPREFLMRNELLGTRAVVRLSTGETYRAKAPGVLEEHGRG